MILSDIYAALIAYIKGSINDNAVTVFSAYQSSTRPKKPFIMLSIGGFSTQGSPTEYGVDEFGIQTTVLNKKFIVTINSVSDDLHQAEELLNLVKDKLHTNTARWNYFKGEIVPRGVLLGVKPIPAPESAVNESRAILEVEFAMSSIVEDEVGFIETIVVDNAINGEQIIVSK